MSSQIKGPTMDPNFGSNFHARGLLSQISDLIFWIFVFDADPYFGTEQIRSGPFGKSPGMTPRIGGAVQVPAPLVSQARDELRMSWLGL